MPIIGFCLWWVLKAIFGPIERFSEWRHRRVPNFRWEMCWPIGFGVLFVISLIHFSFVAWLHDEYGLSPYDAAVASWTYTLPIVVGLALVAIPCIIWWKPMRMTVAGRIVRWLIIGLGWVLAIPGLVIVAEIYLVIYGFIPFVTLCGTDFVLHEGFGVSQTVARPSAIVAATIVAAIMMLRWWRKWRSQRSIAQRPVHGRVRQEPYFAHDGARVLTARYDGESWRTC
jgi:hypothetical protein